MRRGSATKPELAELQQIPSIGPSLAQDLYDLGIRCVGALRSRNPESLYKKLCDLRGGHQDRCVLYSFRCAVYFATETKHDPELLKWWNWQDGKGAKRAKPAKAATNADAKRDGKKSAKKSAKKPSRPKSGSTSMTGNEFRRLALALPEAIESAHMNHPDFRVGGKVFASLGPNEEWGMVKLSVDEQKTFLAANPAAFAPASGAWGRRGCMIVQLGAAEKSIVRQALLAAWRNTAPDRLVGRDT